jgi:hypothetical protein
LLDVAIVLQYFYVLKMESFLSALLFSEGADATYMYNIVRPLSVLVRYK